MPHRVRSEEPVFETVLCHICITFASPNGLGIEIQQKTYDYGVDMMTAICHWSGESLRCQWKNPYSARARLDFPSI